jgi:hypothetical protein
MVAASVRLDANFVVDSVTNSLLAAKISLSRPNGLIEVFISICVSIQLRFPGPTISGQAPETHESCIAFAERTGNRTFTARQLGLHELSFESDGHLLANENAASL